MHPEILKYNEKQELSDKEICDFIAHSINQILPYANATGV